MTYTATVEDLRETAADLIEIVKSGKVKIPINQRYALADAAKAQQDLEARKTTGTTILIP
jgi:NADPH2:quinone reductase